MKKTPVVVVIDAGTSSVKAFAFFKDLQIVTERSVPLHRWRPQQGWVEQDPAEMVRATHAAVRHVVTALPKHMHPVSLGITNQRETTVLWDAVTGRALAPAVVWEDRRTAAWCAEFKKSASAVHRLTGLPITPYFSASKMVWLLTHAPHALPLLAAGRIRVGTVDTWLVWHLTDGAVYATDRSNASRTLLVDIRQAAWSGKLLAQFGIPRGILPDILPSVADFGTARLGTQRLPIRVVAGDQQAGLAAAAAGAGDTKLTFGTGLFADQFLGKQPRFGLGYTTSLAATPGRAIRYVAEAHLPGAGARVDRVVKRPKALARTLDALAHQSVHLLARLPLPIRRLTIDGGSTRDGYLGEVLRHRFGLPIREHRTFHGTALGVATLLWEDRDA